jgi:hypothetical protein
VQPPPPPPQHDKPRKHRHDGSSYHGCFGGRFVVLIIIIIIIIIVLLVRILATIGGCQPGGEGNGIDRGLLSTKLHASIEAYAFVQYARSVLSWFQCVPKL